MYQFLWAIKFCAAAHKRWTRLNQAWSSNMICYLLLLEGRVIDWWISQTTQTSHFYRPKFLRCTLLDVSVNAIPTYIHHLSIWLSGLKLMDLRSLYMARRDSDSEACLNSAVHPSLDKMTIWWMLQCFYFVLRLPQWRNQAGWWNHWQCGACWSLPEWTVGYSMWRSLVQHWC